MPGIYKGFQVMLCDADFGIGQTPGNYSACMADTNTDAFTL